MKLNITLEDPKYCDGCPCHRDDNLNICTYYTVLFKGAIDKTLRHKQCVEENGE